MTRPSLRERAGNIVSMIRDPLGMLERLAPRGDAVPIEFLGDQQVLLLRHPALP